MKSYLLSVVIKKLEQLGPDGFAKANSHDWVVWEPGSWQPAQRAGTVLVRTKETGSKPLEEPKGPPKSGESLLFALLNRAGERAPVSLGRGEECDLVVNDGTLSQVHLLFERVADAYTVRDMNSKNGSLLDRLPLWPGQAVALTPGGKILAGKVELTFHTTASLIGRLKV
jgi:hypothetical protein